MPTPCIAIAWRTRAGCVGACRKPAYPCSSTRSRSSRWSSASPPGWLTGSTSRPSGTGCTSLPCRTSALPSWTSLPALWRSTVRPSGVLSPRCVGAFPSCMRFLTPTCACAGLTVRIKASWPTLPLPCTPPIQAKPPWMLRGSAPSG
ncbi:hypothetical protein MPH_11043 [Macrophomina phaseolina MS6]|uniref:Uncharacterized protein n=1 Tax=Macrophomina phaseolina (strain MS6) TaxID=1126212 RepID=K2S4E7_MACPH|nr:hypothetical protein MPH_11043 [Macrophomina phaseolina MS6]